MSSAFERSMGSKPLQQGVQGRAADLPLDPHFLACARPFEIRRSRDTLQTILVDVFAHDEESLARVRAENRIVLATMICENDLASWFYETGRSYWPRGTSDGLELEAARAANIWKRMSTAQRHRLLSLVAYCPKWGENLRQLTKVFDHLGLTERGANPHQRRPSRFATIVAEVGKAALHSKKEKKACPPSSRTSGTSRRRTATSASSRSTAGTRRSSTTSSATPKSRR